MAEQFVLSTAEIDAGWTLNLVVPPKKPQSKIDLNAAGLDELCTLPGIGRSRAARIIEWRDANGPFSDASALLAIEGIGSRTLAALAPRLA